MPRQLDWPWPPSTELIPELARAHNGTCLLSFSCGKDAIATWLAIREHFTRIVPVYFYSCPGLRFVEDALAYYEAFFGTKILRLPHPTMIRWLQDGFFQSPGNRQTIHEIDPEEYDYEDAFAAVRDDEGVPYTTLVMQGVRAADSPVRHAAMKKHGPVNAKRGVAYPIYDWALADIKDAMRRAKVKLPIDYKWFGRSFDGVDARFILPIKQHAPEDYARLREFYPLIEASIAREYLFTRYYAAKTAA